MFLNLSVGGCGFMSEFQNQSQKFKEPVTGKQDWEGYFFLTR